MKLYYSPGACSLSPHIVAREAGVDLQLVRVDLKTHETEHGDDYYAINPHGYVPLLELADGTRLREGPVISQFLADQVPDRKLVPPAGTMGRVRLQEWLTYIGTELHKQFYWLFHPAPAETQQAQREKIAKGLAQLESTPCLVRLPARRTVHRRRRVCVYSGELVQSREHRSGVQRCTPRVCSRTEPHCSAEARCTTD